MSRNALGVGLLHGRIAHRRKVIAALILSFTLAVPYLAEAACAWVLWERSFECDGCPPEEFFPTGASTTKEECEQVSKKLDEASKRYHRMIGSTTKIFLSCLPDTIDPRGPKGGQ